MSAEETARFRNRVLSLIEEGTPVKVYCGSGHVPRIGFLNIDFMRHDASEFYASHPEDFFVFPFADEPWGLPNDCIDYIFHEDFIEHVDQTSQFQFLAETLRVLKPGCWHRVNTPDLIATMKRNSDFSRGAAGVYAGERQWQHVSIFSRLSLMEAATTVGYREVVFTTRNHGVSPFAEPDFRPGDDRDPVLGNIYADLLK